MSHRLITSDHGHIRVHGVHAIGRINRRIAVAITTVVGTMWCFYAFNLLAFMSGPQAIRALLAGDTGTFVAWMSSNYIQLVLLPAIIVGQRVIAATQDARALADHEAVVALYAINQRQLAILELLRRPPPIGDSGDETPIPSEPKKATHDPLGPPPDPAHPGSSVCHRDRQ